ncbi:MAG: response regulator, partial [Meiothermus ruber]|nr:response regulator [Meiothermus ruber]
MLIVDDEPLFLRSLAEGLQPYCKEFQVLTATDGSEAVRILEKENVDLLISDLRMPGTDGLALVAYAASAFPSMPIVVMTAYGSEAMGRSLQGLVHTYLEKPFRLPQLLETIRRALSAGEMSRAYAPTLSRVLQLIELERKVCDVWVTAEGKMGVLHC